MRKAAFRWMVAAVTGSAVWLGLGVSTAAPASATGFAEQPLCSLRLTATVQATNCEFVATGASGSITWLAADLGAAQGQVGYLNRGCGDPLGQVVAVAPVTSSGWGTLTGVQPGDCVEVSLVGDIISRIGHPTGPSWATGLLLVSG